MKYYIVFLLIVLTSGLQAQDAGTDLIRNVVPADAFQTAIAVSDSGVQKLLVWINKREAQLNASAPSKGMSAQASNLNLSKSNVNRAKGHAHDLSLALHTLKNTNPTEREGALADLRLAMEILDISVNTVLRELQSGGRATAAQAAELLKRHDTVKNSINNIRA